MPRTTADCKAFADFCRKNPSVISCIYINPRWPRPEDPDPQEIVAPAQDPRKWTRDFRRRPDREPGATYDIFDVNRTYERMGYDRLVTRPATDFVWVRGFICDFDTYDTGVRFLVLEDTDGNLHLGDYYGD